MGPAELGEMNNVCLVVFPLKLEYCVRGYNVLQSQSNQDDGETVSSYYTMIISNMMNVIFCCNIQNLCWDYIIHSTASAIFNRILNKETEWNLPDQLHLK